MSGKTSLAALAGIFFLSLTLQAETPPAVPGTPPKTEDSSTPDRFWQATLEGGHYMVSLDRISAISRHSYVLDGAAIVDEVTIDAVGQAIVRFYFIKPLTEAVAGNAVAEAATRLTERAKGLLDTAVERSGSEIQNMVVKKYPLTTHARSIEYRLLSEEDLTALYTSIRTAWEQGRGRKFSTVKK
jgi:hypothetical protein